MANSWSLDIQELNVKDCVVMRNGNAARKAQSYARISLDGMKHCIAEKALLLPSIPANRNKFLCSFDTPNVVSHAKNSGYILR